ncbi:hypothetical protein G7Y79_00002g007710 [Physcia stellaris]|nr:hypothetical protein G7Y79_00002g007710 [Physcia stellaris]
MALLATVIARFHLAILFVSQLATLKSAYPTSDSDHLSFQQPHLERSALRPPITNVSANLPPLGFTFTADRDTRSADSRTVFWLVVTAIADLSKQPFDGFADEAWMVKKPGSGGMFILLSNPSHDHGGFDVKYMIWGLMSAIRYMDAQGLFRNFRFTLKFGNEIVGTITIGGVRGEHSLDDGVKENSSNLPAASSKVNDFLTFHVQWSSTRRLLPFSHVMMALIGGYSDLAIHHMDDRAESSWRTTFSPYEPIVELQTLIEGVPWWTYGLLSDALGQFFGWYFRRHPLDSRSAFLAIKIDGQLQAQGRIFG